MTSETIDIQFSISRFDPEKNQKPYMQSFTLTIPKDSDMMLLQALILLKQQDESLSFRRSCGEGVCGSDGMNINGKNGLACITPLSSLKTPIVLHPLPGLPIIRDLIVDMEPFYKQYERVEPWLQNDDGEPPAKERLQSPEERAKLDGLVECILCACCTTACPSFWWNRGDEHGFVGPAAALALNRFVQDSRDTEEHARLEKMQDPKSLYSCRTIMNCVSVCPKDLNPSKAIAELRMEMLEDNKK